MRACPNCGYENEGTATTCEQCSRALPPPTAPEQVSATPALQSPMQLPNEPAQDIGRKKRQYLRGLGQGLIPLFIFLLATGFSFRATFGSSSLGTAAFLLFISLLAYIVALISMIVCLSSRQNRFVGYGLLTAVLASPIIGGIACVASINFR